MEMTRRRFLTAGVAAGGIAATAALPAFADDPKVFPRRGRFERMSLQYFEIKAGATKPFSVLHISDTHLTAAYDDESEQIRNIAKRRTVTFGGHQEEALRDSIAWAKAHNDYIVHTGDLMDMFSRANLDLVKKYFGEAGDLMLACPGNHEYYWGQRKGVKNDARKDNEVSSALSQVYPSAPHSLSSTVINGVNFLMLDNSRGGVTPEQATRFEAEVNKGLPIILCMHCPFSTYNIVRAARRFWRTDGLKHIDSMKNFKDRYKDRFTAQFAEYLKDLPLLKAILCGHVHIGVVDRFSPSAMQYEVAGNFLFHGQEFVIS